MSAKPDPEDGVIPAIYVHFIRRIVRIGREHGYAIAVHGSMRRDLDLVAVPWIDCPAQPESLADAIRRLVTDHHSPLLPPVTKPHGRLAWIIPVGAGLAVDLSVMPPTSGDEGRAG